MLIKSQYTQFTIKKEDDNESYVEIIQTDWYKNIVKNRTPQKALRLFRYRDNLTQAALEKKLGIPVRHVSGMETGRRTISPRMARKLGEMSLDFLDITDTLDSTKQWYNWDTMKEFVKKTGVDSFRFDVNVTD